MERAGEPREAAQRQGGSVAGWQEGQWQPQEEAPHASPSGSLHLAEGQAGSQDQGLPVGQRGLGISPSPLPGMGYDHLCPPPPKDGGRSVSS